MDVEIEVRFTIKNLIDEESLDEYHKGDLIRCVKEIIDHLGILGVVEDDFKIFSAKELKCE